MKYCYVYALLIIMLPLTSCDRNETVREKGSELNKKSSINSVQPERKLFEPCQLITAAEAESIIGEKVKEASYGEQKIVGLKKCFYESAVADSVKFLQVTVQQSDFMPENIQAAGQSPKSIFEDTRTMLAQNRTDLTGLGDKAFIATGGLHMLIADCYITIGAGNPGLDETRSMIENAAAVVLEKIKHPR